MNCIASSQYDHRLVSHGVILFLLGLLTGFGIPAMENPRMGLSSHLEAIMNGMFLMLLGCIWHRLRLKAGTQRWTYRIALFGTYANWMTTFLAAVWGAGGAMMPIAAGDRTGSFLQEIIIKAGLISLSLAMVVVCGFVLWGLRDRITVAD